jgi:hypothetical protein
MATRILFSIVLAYLTGELISAIDYLPFSPARDSINDVLRFPGGLIAWPFYSQGIHTDGGAYWGLVAYLGNMAFYATLWFVLLSVLRRNRDRRQSRL